MHSCSDPVNVGIWNSDSGRRTFTIMRGVMPPTVRKVSNDDNDNNDNDISYACDQFGFSGRMASGSVGNNNNNNNNDNDNPLHNRHHPPPFHIQRPKRRKQPLQEDLPSSSESSRRMFHISPIVTGDSVKKSVKKLLGQLTATIEERDHSSKLLSMSSLLEGGNTAKSSLQKEETMLDSSFHSIEETMGTTWDRNVTHLSVATSTVGDDKASFIPSEVASRYDGHSQSDVIQLNASTSYPSSARSQRPISTIETASSPSSSTSSPNKTISHLRQQLKKEKGAHESTQFRMKVRLSLTHTLALQYISFLDTMK
jgi:hypothetical protein